MQLCLTSSPLHIAQAHGWVQRLGILYFCLEPPLALCMSAAQAVTTRYGWEILQLGCKHAGCSLNA